ncbi:TetR/AcrR family transcriptional regulator [Actinophytocola sp.]|uniref:TetR/AcrR family transcriptional regulator n=1 Tax=Actinophytocola sp. TaxID=1872138 RepID=UPI00389B030A
MAAPRQRRTATASTAAEPASDIARRRMERRAASGRRSDARWEEILAGAGRVFARLGYGRSTLEDVAGEVGIRRATLYYYVGTKEELLVGLLHDPIETMRTRLEEVAALPVPAPERLERALREYVRTMAELPELFIFMGENVHQVMSGPEADHIRANADRYGRVLAQVIQSGAAAGEFRTDIDPSVAVLGIIGMFNWMHRWYNPNGSRKLEEFGDVFIEMALSSLAPQS